MLTFGDLLPYLGLLVIVQLCRSLRWNNLLAPLGVRDLNPPFTPERVWRAIQDAKTKAA